LGEEREYETYEASELLGVGEARVRQIASEYQIGSKRRKLWKFSFEDIILLDAHVKRGKSKRVRRAVMRDVTPGVANGEIVETSYAELAGMVKRRLDEVQTRIFHLGQDIYQGTNNMLVKEVNRWTVRTERQEAEIREALHRIVDLEKGFSELSIRLEKEKPKEGRGRAASILGGTARLTSQHDAAPMAA
jgi:hypothetical protein